MMRVAAALGALAWMGLAPVAWAEGDAAKGERVFRKCAACHTVDADGAKRAGPNLHGVTGRTVGTVEGFGYSQALQAAAEAGDVWTDERLSDFLADPRAHYKGHKMAFAGLKKAEERNDLIAYLHLHSAGAE